MTGQTVTDLTNGTEYTFEVRAVNTAGEGEAASRMATPMATPMPTRRGQITEMKVTGGRTEEKIIGGTKRVHVVEGATDVKLSMTVQWDHAELTALHAEGATHAAIWVVIRGAEPADQTHHVLPDWTSWIDGNGDVDFPTGDNLDGNFRSVVQIKLPAKPKADDFPHSTRHHKSNSGELRILVKHDEQEAENDAFYIEVERSADVDLNAGSAVNRTTPLIVIEDDDEQRVWVSKSQTSSAAAHRGPTSAYEPAGDPEITDPVYYVHADPDRVDLPLEVRLEMTPLGGTTVSQPGISLSKASMRLNVKGSVGNVDSVTVHLPDNDKNREDETYMLNASVNVYSVATGGYETIKVAAHEITVIDRHKLPTLTASSSADTVKEGGMVELELTINRNPSVTYVGTPAINSGGKEKREYTDEEVSIMLDMGAGSTAGASDFSVMTNPVVFPERERGSTTQKEMVEVMATADDVLDDGEKLVLDAMLSGEADYGSDKRSEPGVVSLTIEDGTAELVWAKTQEEVEAAVYAAKNAGMGDDMMFNPGDMIELMGSALFNAAQGVTISYTAMTSDASVASTSVDSGGVAMVTAMGAGMADITITAHASMPSGVKIVDQTDPREASIMFPVEVGLEALTLMLTGPEDMNVVEGGMGAMVTATANRAVTEEVTVMLMRDRAMSSASDDDYTAEPITIMAGQMSGSTMVMAVEDDMMESVDNMAEELVLYGMTEGMAGEVTGEVKLYLWDAAVPALPVIAQLLLAALMAVGGYRRYRRR